MARLNIEKDVRAAIVAAGLGLVAGTNVFRGRVVDRTGIPAKAVFIKAGGGQQAVEYQDESGVAMRQPGVTIRIRSDVDMYDAGYDLANDVLNALHLRPPAGYIEWAAGQSAPIYIEADDSGRHHWSVNLAVTYDEDKDA